MLQGSLFGVKGTFPKAFSKRATSQVTILPVATSQMCNFLSGKVMLDLLRRHRLHRGPSAAARTC